MTQSELSGAQLAVVEQVRKLLNLAAKNPNEHEAAAAAAKAQELLAKHNLSTETVERAAGVADGRREQAAVDGGFYSYQRDLWRAVAELNFCIYWAQRYRTKGRRQIREEVWDEARGEYRRKVVGQVQVEDRLRTRHVVVGKIVNVRSTIAMASYLLAAIERATLKRTGDEDVSRLSNWAVSFRKGASRSVVSKLQEKRAIVLDEEERAEADRERAAAAGASTSTVLTVAKLSATERDANLDFVHGEGYSARIRAYRAEAAKERAEQEAAYTAWAAANPKEVARRKAEEEKREDRNARRRKGRSWSGYGARDDVDWSAFRAGRDAGEKIGLDPQVDAGQHSKIGR